MESHGAVVYVGGIKLGTRGDQTHPVKVIPGVPIPESSSDECGLLVPVMKDS